MKQRVGILRKSKILFYSNEYAFVLSDSFIIITEKSIYFF